MERELDEAANRTAYFLAVHSGETEDVCSQKTEHLKTSADTALYCSTQHLNGHSVLQLFDGTPHRAFDSWRGQPTPLIFIGGV